MTDRIVIPHIDDVPTRTANIAMIELGTGVSSGSSWCPRLVSRNRRAPTSSDLDLGIH